jgi:Secretion system C-terminal sorting domain
MKYIMGNLQLNKNSLWLFLLFFSSFCKAQNKSGYTWIVGNNASYGKFDGTTNRPLTGSFYNPSSPNYAYAFTGGHSNISDSVTGKLILLCNGMQLFDTLGNIIENGDTLVPLKPYKHDTYPNSSEPQSSLILPKGNNGEYYVFITTLSDTSYDKWTLPTATKAPNDMLLYNVVDMNANGGMGKVIKKSIPLLTNTEMSRTGMQACRHSNGVDWWLLKKTGLEENNITRFLVTKDSIYGPFVLTFTAPFYEIFDKFGQSCFSKDGKKYAQVFGKSNKLFMADFDRCTGELSNPKVYTIPIDSSGTPQLDANGYKDSIIGGCIFSPNNNYIYITKRYNIYQFEYNESDSSLAWNHIKQGMDTTWGNFEYYGSLRLGVDNRIYIGKGGGSFKQFSVIDHPDNKGSACGFCRKCFRVDNAYGGLNTPPNIPDFNLGADSSKPCYPLHNYELQITNYELEVYPNPSSTKLTIKYVFATKEAILYQLYNSVGQLIISTKENEVDVSKLSRGLYYLKVENQTKKVIIE